MSVTNPQRIRITNNRKEQEKWRSHVRWKKLVEEHAHVPGAVCVHCGRKHNDPILDRDGNQRCDKNGKFRFVYLTINHISRTRYWSEELYCTWDENDMEICCSDCNWRIEAGEKICPICKKTYIHWRDYSCQGCWDAKHPDEAAKRKEEQAVKRIRARKLKRKLDKEAREKWMAEHPLSGKHPKVNNTTNKNSSKS